MESFSRSSGRVIAEEKITHSRIVTTRKAAVMTMYSLWASERPRISSAISVTPTTLQPVLSDTEIVYSLLFFSSSVRKKLSSHSSTSSTSSVFREL